MHFLIVQMCYKSNCGRFYYDLTLKPSRSFCFLLHWKFILGERINKYMYKQSHSSTEKFHLKLTVRLSHASVMACCWALQRDLHIFYKEIHLLRDIYMCNTSRKVIGRLYTPVVGYHSRVYLIWSFVSNHAKQATLVLE